MNEFEKELLKKFRIKDFEKIQQTRVGIAGCGGLGSNCVVNLVRSGLKNFVIVDFDVVEKGNLDRQFYFADQVGMKKTEALQENLLRINPDLHISVHNMKLNKDNIVEIFSECKIIVEAFDMVETKTMLAGVFMGTDKFIVSGSGLAGFGNSDNIKTNKVKHNFIVIGDMVTDVKNLPPFSPKVNIVAAKQADTIIEYLVNN